MKTEVSASINAATFTGGFLTWLQDGIAVLTINDAVGLAAMTVAIIASGYTIKANHLTIKHMRRRKNDLPPD